MGSKWSSARIGRDERELMAASLDERIGAEHGVRVLDELLRKLDWSEWEAAYDRGGAGRPPIHPRLMCGAILYGLVKRLRSTRELEEATRMRLDFQWLMEGRTVDHTTFSVFRKRFDGAITGLFRQLNREVGRLHHATLEEVMIDGTRLRADSDRHGALSARGLEKRLEALEEEIAGRLAKLELESADDGDEPQEPPAADEQIEAELARLETQRVRLQAALEEVRRRDEIKRAKKGAKASAARLPMGDPDCHIMPNKEGGYAPNYTPVVAVDGGSGLIVAGEVAEANAEAATVGGLIDEARDMTGAEVSRVVFDGGFASGANLALLGERNVEVYAPAGAPSDNPAVRPDPAVPVATELLDGLPMRGGKLDRAAFLYDPLEDLYHCPMGRELVAARKIKRAEPGGGTTRVTEYRCADCSGCPLSARCLSRKAKVRTVGRDIHQPLRDELAERMTGQQAKDIYARRAPVVEGAFGIIKSALGIRRFSRRGMGRVRAEWQWICAAFNVMKHMKAVDKPATAGRGTAKADRSCRWARRQPDMKLESARFEPVALPYSKIRRRAIQLLAA